MAVENLITEHIDIWTSAVKTRSTSGRGSSKKLELYGIKKLRELILELAVRGKLVPQDSSDEPSSVLLERIKDERRAEAKNGKLKEVKAISENEFPYKLPINWSFVRLEEIIQISSGKNLTAKKMDTSGKIPVYGGNGVTGIHSESNVSEKTIVIGRVGFYCGSVHLTPACAWVTDNAFITKYSRANLDEDFLVWLLKATNLGENDSATAQPVISGKKVYPIVVALPPKEEQRLIAAKIDELMALCDQLEQQTEASIEAHQVLVTTLLDTLTNSVDADELMKNWARISEHFDTLFTTEESIDQLKQTILQLAVMGKLVPQDPSDEPAAELLKRIAEEKAQLVKEKKIKKQKALPPISEDEKPFELPSGWSYERLGNICEKMGSGSTPRGGQSAYVTEGIPFLRSQNVWNGELKLNDIAYIPQETHDKMENTKVYPGDVLLNITGASLGRSTIFPEEISEANVSQHVTIIRLIEPKMKEFIHIGIISPLIQNLVWGRQVGMAIEGLSKKVLEQFEFPVPPLEEQKLIVEKVTELLNICEHLKAQLVTSQTTQIQLTDSIVDQMV
ncbi:restriction endonuclease subunit S [Vibrio parahaemolyticus]|uniref:restriction endonuclease subunit S n=2 Tax=Vibrio parahaemolyticus TaxID=670 RepID=UPI00111DCFC1|nr:restriction endonuclease subunit S [Vibrio parahaemolyticus]TOA50056.1 restriction endonuclease subunit S [Vibrio parahaemolyticus]TOA97915.1 restriction endonuclease subunit S [Vibrio parahaemolyticus]